METKEKEVKYPFVGMNNEDGIFVQTGPRARLAGRFTSPIYAEKAMNKYLAQQRHSVEKRKAKQKGE